MKKSFLFFVIILLVTSCKTAKPIEQTKVSKNSATAYTPYSFTKALKKKNKLGVTIVENDFPEDWVKKEDIDYLITIVDSKKKCNCYISPRTRSIPRDQAQLGGFALEFIKAFKEERSVDLGLYNCPKMNEKEAEELKAWWGDKSEAEEAEEEKIEQEEKEKKKAKKKKKKEKKEKKNDEEENEESEEEEEE